MPNQGHDSFDNVRDPEWEAMARFLAGESTPEEAASVERRLSESSDESVLLAALGRVTNQLANEPLPDIDVERALARVRLRFTESGVRSLDSARSRRRFVSSQPARWMAVAAAVVVIAATALLWKGQRRGGAAGPFVSPVQTYTAAVGSRDSVRLSDGTRVLLGPGSELTVASGYGSSHRDVTLRGEAFIQVEHGPSQPFTVHAGAATIRDVGTAFAVHSDSGTGVRVVVTTGAVLMRRAAGGDSMILRAGDVGVLGRGDSVVARRGSATEDDLAWTRGELVFRDASMEEVRADVRRWYGIELVIADSSLMRQHFNNTFHNDSPDQVLRVIAGTFGARIERHGDTAIVRDAREEGGGTSR